VAKFVVMSNERYRDNEGQWKDGTRTDVRVTAWDTLAANTAESLHKGTTVTVTGRRVEAHPWTGQDDTLRASLELTADDVQVNLADDTSVSSRPSAVATVSGGTARSRCGRRRPRRSHRSGNQRPARPGRR
jgi:single-strand DNA-binding protein